MFTTISRGVNQLYFVGGSYAGALTHSGLDTLVRLAIAISSAGHSHHAYAAIAVLDQHVLPAISSICTMAGNGIVST